MQSQDASSLQQREQSQHLRLSVNPAALFHTVLNAGFGLPLGPPADQGLRRSQEGAPGDPVVVELKAAVDPGKEGPVIAQLRRRNGDGGNGDEDCEPGAMCWDSDSGWAAAKGLFSSWG